MLRLDDVPIMKKIPFASAVAEMGTQPVQRPRSGLAICIQIRPSKLLAAPGPPRGYGLKSNLLFVAAYTQPHVHELLA